MGSVEPKKVGARAEPSRLIEVYAYADAYAETVVCIELVR